MCGAIKEKKKTKQHKNGFNRNLTRAMPRRPQEAMKTINKIITMKNKKRKQKQKSKKFNKNTKQENIRYPLIFLCILYYIYLLM